MTNELRDSFPFFKENPDTIYLDSASTSQKLKSALDRLYHFYSSECSNIGRSSYNLASRAQSATEDVRKKTAEYLGCKEDEIIFTKSATESSNLVCGSFLAHFLDEKSNVVTTVLEHDSSFLPLKMASKSKKAGIRMVMTDSNGGISVDEFEKRIDKNTKAAVFTCASNISSTSIDYSALTRICKRKGVISVLDATQLLPHERIDVKKLECDFLYFSAHKMYSTSGCGVLYAKSKHIKAMRPHIYGGGTIESVSPLKLLRGPGKFEAGSPDVGSILALGQAIDFFVQNRELIESTEKELRQRLFSGFERIKDKVDVIGDMSSGIPLVSFTCKGISSYDLAAYLAVHKICVRSGEMCAHIFFDKTSNSPCVRVSLGVYNTREEIDAFFDELNNAFKYFRL